MPLNQTVVVVVAAAAAAMTTTAGAIITIITTIIIKCNMMKCIQVDSDWEQSRWKILFLFLHVMQAHAAFIERRKNEIVRHPTSLIRSFSYINTTKMFVFVSMWFQSFYSAEAVNLFLNRLFQLSKKKASKEKKIRSNKQYIVKGSFIQLPFGSGVTLPYFFLFNV